MSEFVIHRALPFFVGAIFCIIGILYPAYLFGVFDPIPYQDVKVRSVERVGGVVHFEADFVKRGCTFQAIAFVGVGFSGVSPPLPWSDSPGAEREEANRLAGRQTMSVDVDIGGAAFDELEVKTRHDCDGQIIDKVFAAVKIP